MNATATRPLFDLFAEQQPDSRVSGNGDLTLEQRISSVWEGLLRTGTADCPVCRGPMERAGDSGHCLRCGSVLS
jgi:tRNA(Ile2) C34 agmatinyltransferase TiaS